MSLTSPPRTRPTSLLTRGVAVDEATLSRRLSHLAVSSSSPPQEAASTAFSCSSRRSSTYSSCSSGYSSTSSSAYGSRCGSLRRHGRQPAGMSPEAVEKAMLAVALLPGSSRSLLEIARNAIASYEESLRAAADRTVSDGSEEHRHVGTAHLKVIPSPDLQVVEALQEFWSLKVFPPQTRISFCRSSPSMANSTVTYDFAQTSYRSTEYIAFATLPGGACYASVHPSVTKGEARRGAATVALVNSVLNEGSPKRLTPAYIHRLTTATRQRQANRDALSDQRSRSLCSLSSLSLPLTPTSEDNQSFISHESDQHVGSVCTSLSDQPRRNDGCSWQAVDVLQQLLMMNCGKTMAEFRSRMTVFQLLQWSGDLQQAQAHGLSCDDVLQTYLTTPLDDKLRHHLARAWSCYEEFHRGSISRELQAAKEELESLRHIGAELRLPKEKKDILVLAYAMFQRGDRTPVRADVWRKSRAQSLHRRTSYTQDSQ